MTGQIHFDQKAGRFWIKDGDAIRPFDSSLDAKDALRQIELRDAVKAEVELIAERDDTISRLKRQIDALNDALAQAEGELAELRGCP